MTMKFFDSPLCKSRVHCLDCRKLEEGRQLRTVWSKVFKTEGVDFKCPHLPWGASLNQVIVLRMETNEGLTPEIALGHAKRRSCCDPPAKD